MPKLSLQFRALLPRTRTNFTRFPWLKPDEKNVSGNSSWVAWIKWAPLGSRRGNLWFRTKQGNKVYLAPSIEWKQWLRLLNPKLVSDAGVGHKLWELGIFKGKGSEYTVEATGQKGRPEQNERFAELSKYFNKKGLRQATLARQRKAWGLWVRT